MQLALEVDRYSPFLYSRSEDRRSVIFDNWRPVNTILTPLETSGYSFNTMWQQQISFLPRNIIVMVCFLSFLVFIASMRKSEQKLYYVGKIPPLKSFHHVTKEPGFQSHSLSLSKRNIKSLPTIEMPSPTLPNMDKLQKLSEGMKLPIITLFTTWIPSMEKDYVYMNTLRVWASLKPYVQPVVFTNILSIAQKAKEHGWKVLPPVRTTCGGVPILKEMYLSAEKSMKSIFYCFANADILMNKGFVETAIAVIKHFQLEKKPTPMFVIGKRIETLMENAASQILDNAVQVDNLSMVGNMSWGYAVDYFMSNKNFPWKKAPDIVIGRPVYDNWMVSFARKQNSTIVEGTSTITAVHQKTRKRGRNRNMCNKKLLIENKLMRRMPLEQGRIECVAFISRYSYDNEVIIMPRKQMLKGCKLWQ